MPELEQEWWMGDGGRITPPKPPKGMRWVRHPFNRQKYVLDAALPVKPVERVTRWTGWEPLAGVIAMILFGLFLVFIGAS